MAKELIDIVGTITVETDMAYLFDSGSNEVWLPKSQCQWDRDENTMTIPEWLAREKELI